MLVLCEYTFSSIIIPILLTPKVPRGQILAFAGFGHVPMIRRCDMIFWEFYSREGIRRAFCEAKECKILTFIVGVMVIKRILFI
jgi:hypothetical protein